MAIYTNLLLKIRFSLPNPTARGSFDITKMKNVMNVIACGPKFAFKEMKYLDNG